MRTLLILLTASLFIISCKQKQNSQSEKTSQNKPTHYLLIGPYSPNLGDAKVGDTGVFSMGDPEGINYGNIKIKQGGSTLKKVTMGGWTIPITSPAANAISISGQTKKPLLYGVLELDSKTLETTLEHKGDIKVGIINITIP